MTPVLTLHPPWAWVIAIGNAQREEDGIGRRVADILRRQLPPWSGVAVESTQSLDPSLLEEVQTARCILFVDAGIDTCCDDIRWTAVEPDFNGWAMGFHRLTPAVFLGLLGLLYHCKPTAWEVAVRAGRFGWTDRLNERACVLAEAAAAQITDWLSVASVRMENEVETWITEKIS